MERRNCIKNLISIGICCSPMTSLASDNTTNISALVNKDDLALLMREKEFIMNWTNDLLETIDKELDLETKVKLMEGCGRGCYNRFQFKQDIAEQGKDDLEKLISAYRQNYEIWKDEEGVHIRYGEKAKRCYCPAAQVRQPQPNDLHCECTRTTHQTIFEEALGVPVKVKIIESLRRGGKTCHFIVLATT